MESSVRIWDGSSEIKLVNRIPEGVRKLRSIGRHLYLLTAAGKLYHGFIELLNGEQLLELVFVEGIRGKDLDCGGDTVYIVDFNGKVLAYTESLEFVKEIMLVEESRMCFHGHQGARFKMKVDSIAVGGYGCLFVTESGQLWASGNMHQIGVNSPSPKRVGFFDNRVIHSCNVGTDFAVAIVSKQKLSDDTDSDDCEEDVFVSTCPHCLSTSPISQNSLSETCPLGIPLPVSYDIETTSTSSKNDSVSSTETHPDPQKSEKNIIFRNTEAAKEFLTRQFSWMSSAGEEYLVECTEKPTRIIKENVTNMASLVFEGVKTVGDKVVTLSRHVSGSSENNAEEEEEPRPSPRVNSKEEMAWSLSQGTSERDGSGEQGLRERCEAVLREGANLLNCEVWTWGNIVHGQLGVGDIMKRERPMIITKLSNCGARKVTAQTHHAGVLTLDGRAFLWGRNDRRQVTTECNVDQSSPRLFQSSPTTDTDVRIKDISCGDFYTVLLTSEDTVKCLGKCSRTVIDLYQRKEMTNSKSVVDLHENESSIVKNTMDSYNTESKEVRCRGKHCNTDSSSSPRSNDVKCLGKCPQNLMELHCLEPTCAKSEVDMHEKVTSSPKSVIDLCNKDPSSPRSVMDSSSFCLGKCSKKSEDLCNRNSTSAANEEAMKCGGKCSENTTDSSIPKNLLNLNNENSSPTLASVNTVKCSNSLTQSNIPKSFTNSEDAVKCSEECLKSNEISFSSITDVGKCLNNEIDSCVDLNNRNSSPIPMCESAVKCPKNLIESSRPKSLMDVTNEKCRKSVVIFHDKDLNNKRLPSSRTSEDVKCPEKCLEKCPKNLSDSNLKDPSLFHSKLTDSHNTNKASIPIEEKTPNHLLSSKQFLLLNTPTSNEFIIADLIQEQKFLEEMLLVQTNLIKPLQKKNLQTSDSILYETLCKNYVDLLNFTAANIKSLIDFCNKSILETDIVMFRFAEEHIFIYRNYLNVLHDIVSVGGCVFLMKLLDLPACLQKLSFEANSKQEDVKKDKKLEETKKDKKVEEAKKDQKKSEETIIQNILTRPLSRLAFYENLIHSFMKHLSKAKVRHDVLSKWTLLIEEQEAKKSEAELTKNFWVNSGKTIEQLKSPQRRLIRESHQSPIFLQNASRFSTHWFILLTDVFVHLNGSTLNIHNLATIWVEPQQEQSNNHSQFQITLKTPEDTIELYTTEPEQKVEWFHALQNSIKVALGREGAHQPPSLRSASYAFVKNGALKDSRYCGRWLNGRLHGSGRLEWADGRAYVGQFSNNQMHGFGRMEEPNKGVYEGQWKDNQQNGFGIFKHANGDVYKGHFRDGVAHGHGFLRQGHFMANAASIYIGDWTSGSKNGYGIMDDIVTGEKYLGNWSDNRKHGHGLIVTSEGIYYEGVFNQDVLTGHGVMILEDGTHYEGDFKGTGILSGKGTLTLKSGHTIEGTLTGSWNEGIKISNAILVPNSRQPSQQDAEAVPKSFGTYCTPVDQKWKGLFRHCYQVLGMSETSIKNGGPKKDTQKIWQNVAVVISNAHQGIVKKGAGNALENTINQLDTIPQACKESLDPEGYIDVKQYLLKAFECSYHPLGSLLNDITVAYTTAYGSRAHPLLLLHAVTELHSIIKRLYDIVRLLFPALPSYGKEVTLDSSEDESDVISCQSLLYPIILPKVHLSLFTLYTLRNKQHDAQYWKRLLEWNKQPDYTLMAFLYVDQKFIKSEIPGEPKSPPPTLPATTIKDQRFIEAVETLQLLKTTFSPLEKLLVIRATFKKMTEVVREQLGPDYRWNMDDLLPVFLYVVVRARILQLGSELDFIEDFMEPSLESGELGIMFTTLKACYQQILQERLTIN